MGEQELMDDGSGLPTDPEQLGSYIEDCDGKIAGLQAKIAQEVAKVEKYRVSLWPPMSQCVQWATNLTVLISFKIKLSVYQENLRH